MRLVLVGCAILRLVPTQSCTAALLFAWKSPSSSVPARQETCKSPDLSWPFGFQWSRHHSVPILYKHRPGRWEVDDDANAWHDLPAVPSLPEWWNPEIARKEMNAHTSGSRQSPTIIFTNCGWSAWFGICGIAKLMEKGYSHISRMKNGRLSIPDDRIERSEINDQWQAPPK